MKDSSAWHRPNWSRPWIIAHRGDSAHAPENTLEAAQRAWDVGADAWEVDVRLTRDRVPVVMHDASLLRTTNVAQQFANDPRQASSFRLADFDLAEVASLDAARWFLAAGREARAASGFGTLSELSAGDRAWFASGEVKVPTLAAALALTDRLDWHINIELKSSSADDPELLDRVLGLVSTPALAARVAISSFDHNDVARVARLRPEIVTGVLTANPLYRPAEYVAREVGARAYHASAEALGAGSEAYRRAPSARALCVPELEALQAAGVPVYAYTVNDAEVGGLAEHLIASGVAGVFSDNPRSLVARWGDWRAALERAHRRPELSWELHGG